MPLTINLNYQNPAPPPAAQAAIRRAADTWQAALDSTVPINVDVFWGTPLGSLVGMCVPYAFKTFLKAPLANTWYVSAMANKLTGADLLPGYPDLALYFNSNGKNFNYGPGLPAHDAFDLESNALHEMGHGLGFVGLFWVVAATQSGSYGSNYVTGAIPGTLPLPFPNGKLPNLHGLPSNFGRRVQDQHDALLTGMPNDSNQLAAALQSDQLTFRGGHANYPVYAPNPFKPFSSGDHFLPPSTMQPTLAKGAVLRNITADVTDAMNTLGW